MEQAVAHSGLTDIAIVALAAMACGILMERFRQPAIVGYILAGVILGPSAFGLVTDRDQIDTLAELGVLLLLYVVGMELPLRAFRKIWKLAFFTTLIQIIASTLVMLLCWKLFDWSLGLAILLGFVVALSSTAVAIKILGDLGELKTRIGTLTIGVLIAQDLAVVPLMLIVSAMGAFGGGAVEVTSFDWMMVIKIILSIGVMAALIWYLSSGRKINIPFSRIVAGNEDLKPLSALAFCFAAASVSGLLGLSAAYGAFIAGVLIGSSRERHVMIEAAKPIQSILLMVFFLSIGLLLDVGYIWDNIWTVLTMLVVVAIFKTVLNVGALKLLGLKWPQAFMTGIMLSQIGEFSFLLSQVGIDVGLITVDESRIVVAITVLSLACSPVFVVTLRRLQEIAMGGRESAAEIMKILWASEAELIAGTLDGAKSNTLRSFRVLKHKAHLLKAAMDKRRGRDVAVIADVPEPILEDPTPVKRKRKSKSKPKDITGA